MDLVFKIYELASLLPPEEKFGLKSQISRAAVSIPLNIAEGSSRDSAQLLVAKRFKNIDADKLNNALLLLDEVQKMLNAFILKLSQSRKLTAKS